MRIKLASILTAGLLLATSSLALAEHHEGHNHEGGGHWTLMGKEGHIGAQYRFQLTHNDNNFASTKDTDASKTTSLDLSALNIGLDGRLNKAVTFDANVHLQGKLAVAVDEDGAGSTVSDFIHWAYIDWAVNDMITIRGGRDFVNAGGWDNNNWGMYYDMLGSAYRAWNPVAGGGGTADAVEIMVKAGGWVSLQLVNDTVDGSKTTNSPNKQPAMILEYKGQFGKISPLVQIGQYDLNDDRFFVLGVKFMAAGFSGFLDFINDTRNYKVGTKSMSDVTTAINLRLDYTMGTYTPFFELTSLDVKQDGTDSKVNSAALPVAGTPAFDDNAMNWALGVKCNAGMGHHYSPFFVIKNHSGKFVDSSDGNKEVTRSAMTIQTGVMGEF
ncbi:hypothetical protein N9D31_02950 [Oligoflexaceae bacterium]|nr:hypothetical protein [Oligoflexaceae bacterium]